MRTSAWLLQSSWWVLATEICPSQLWTSRWLARSSSPTQMKMKTGKGKWSYCCIMSIDAFGLFVFSVACLCGRCEWQTCDHLLVSDSFLGEFTVTAIWFCEQFGNREVWVARWWYFFYWRWLFWNHLEVAQTHTHSQCWANRFLHLMSTDLFEELKRPDSRTKLNTPLLSSEKLCRMLLPAFILSMPWAYHGIYLIKRLSRY